MARAGGGVTRAKAARQLARVVEHGESLAALYVEWESQERSRDTALERALVTGALRWHHRLRWQLEQLSTRALPAKEGVLAALLRIGLLQLQEMRVPDHAAVAETVAAAALIDRKHAKPLVNAVLRAFLRDRAALERRMREVPEALWSHPEWLIEAVRRDWPDAAERVLEADNQQAPLTLRVNLRRTSVAEYLRALATAQIEYRTHADSPVAVELVSPRPAARIPGYAEGRVSIQDRGAQRAAELLDLAAGLRVLDACAAPGGKTAHICEACPEIGELVAVDIDAARLETLRANMDRLGLAATLHCADVGEPSQWWNGRPFDRILLDAPCTAVGVIRRHPDIKLRREPGDVQRLTVGQQRLLRVLWPLLKPGGRFVYATCSFLRAENEARVRDLLGERSDAALIADEQRLPGEANCDGFYYACLQRRE